MMYGCVIIVSDNILWCNVREMGSWNQITHGDVSKVWEWLNDIYPGEMLLLLVV